MKYILIVMVVFSFGFTQTTLCYKNNVEDITTLENQKFDGGECKGNNSINEMKNNGWVVSDIKIQSKNNSLNYIYILKSKKENVSEISKVFKEEQNKIKLEQNKKRLNSMFQNGKKVYEFKCAECHGKYGEVESHNTSRAINTLSQEEFSSTMNGYNFGTYDRGMALIMTPYAYLTTGEDLDNIYYYLQSINNK
jgi:cytochrome c553